MKTQSYFFYAGLVLGGLMAWRAGAQSAEIVEIPVEHVFSPAEGYDANDPNVVFVLDGKLPNGCYTIAHQEAPRTAGTNHFQVKQFASKRSDGDCAAGAELSPQRAAPVPFTTEISVGRLDEGQYTYSYSTVAGGQPGSTKALRVAAVPTEVSPNARGTDSEPYAMVDAAYVPKIVMAGTSIRVLLGVTLNSSCIRMGEIKAKTVGDTIVLLPTIRVLPGRCIERIEPIEVSTKIDGINLEGRYLLHVRSMNGVAQNRTFSVVVPPGH